MRDKDRPQFAPDAKVGPAHYAKPSLRGKRTRRGEGAPLPPYHRSLRTPATQGSALTDYVAENRTPTIDKTMTPMRQELMARAEALKQHGPAHPRAVDRNGRPTIPRTYTGRAANDPPEKTG